MQRVSRLFWPVLVTPKNAVVKHNTEAVSRSQKLLTELGLVKPAHNGTFQLLPLAQRVMDKCVDLVRQQMCAIEGQQISLPVLTSTALWQKSGRLSGDITEFYMLRDRHGKQFLLSPTHEEAVTAMLASAAPISYRQLPLRLFQIGPKFRDELKSRFGLIRAKEFLMKDMYTFDRDLKAALGTYEQVNRAYETLFQQLEVPYVKVEACTGMMGGSVTHEFHYLAATGEDQLLRCNSCDYAANAETMQTTSSGVNYCPRCGFGATLKEVRGIEVAHTFVLNDKYSLPLGATFLQENGKPENLVMGCYGIGISRLVAATVEVLATENELRWPTLLAPYDVCIIGAKQGSREQQAAAIIEADFCNKLTSVCDIEEVLNDDRNYLTIGKRLLDAKRMGYPFVVVIGNKASQVTPKLELHTSESTMELESHEVLAVLAKHVQTKKRLRNMKMTTGDPIKSATEVRELSCKS